MRIIAVVGQPLSGKDTVAEYLATKGFTHISSGDLIREDMRHLGLPLDRASIRKFVMKRRSQVGSNYPTNEVIEAISGDSIVSGFRNRAEVHALKQKFGVNFSLIAVEASLETRYARAVVRGREGDKISLEEFKKQEDDERGGSVHQEQDAVIAIADFTIGNDGTKEELLEKVDDVMEKMHKMDI